MWKGNNMYVYYLMQMYFNDNEVLGIQGKIEIVGWWRGVGWIKYNCLEGVFFCLEKWIFWVYKENVFGSVLLVV